MSAVGSESDSDANVRMRHALGAATLETEDSESDGGADGKVKSFRSWFDMLYYLGSLTSDTSRTIDDSIKKRLTGRYENVMIVSALVFTVAAEGLMEPSDAIMNADSWTKLWFGILMGLAFSFTLASVLYAAVLLGVSHILPIFLSRWFFENTAGMQKAPMLFLGLGSTCLGLAVSLLAHINFGGFTACVLLLMLVVLAIWFFVNHAHVQGVLGDHMREEHGVEPP
ncbi:unnamed protein product [Prorocentrum cordatum]|uniref:Transmembrane protein n=1 Tax=Prorocentrum cordatum TaxID=2364126 RepID=A0ABN9QGI8_9DINO|nr:unnamed protein product [Polarella glacialis]